MILKMVFLNGHSSHNCKSVFLLSLFVDNWNPWMVDVDSAELVPEL